MIPWDWIGIVTIRSDTRRSTSTNGMISRNPGARGPRTRPSRNSTPCSYCLTIRTASADPSSASSTTMITTAIKTPIAMLRSDLLRVDGGSSVRRRAISHGPGSRARASQYLALGIPAAEWRLKCGGS